MFHEQLLLLFDYFISNTDTPISGENLLWTPPLSPSMCLDHSDPAAHLPPPHNPPHATCLLLSPPLRSTPKETNTPALIRIPPPRHSQDLAVLIPPARGRRDLREAGLVGSRGHGPVAARSPGRCGRHGAATEGADGRRRVPE
jgi:hypothetical protein